MNPDHEYIYVFIFMFLLLIPPTSFCLALATHIWFPYCFMEGSQLDYLRNLRRYNIRFGPTINVFVIFTLLWPTLSLYYNISLYHVLIITSSIYGYIITLYSVIDIFNTKYILIFFITSYIVSFLIQYYSLVNLYSGLFWITLFIMDTVISHSKVGSFRQHLQWYIWYASMNWKSFVVDVTNRW